MPELRAFIDALDADLIEMLAIRARCMDRATELKPALGWPARIDSRVEEVVANVRQEAKRHNLDDVLIEVLWRQLIEWSIAREQRVLGNAEDLVESGMHH
ncbi:MAG: chorismate mutase [Pseudomonadota bacterium]